MLTHDFVLNEGVFTTIDIPGAKITQPYGINPDGEIVGFHNTASLPATPTIHGFVLDQWGVVTQIDVPGAFNTWMRRNNPRGDLVGNYTQVVAAVVMAGIGFGMQGPSNMRSFLGKSAVQWVAVRDLGDVPVRKARDTVNGHHCQTECAKPACPLFPTPSVNSLPGIRHSR